MLYAYQNSTDVAERLILYTNLCVCNIVSTQIYQVVKANPATLWCFPSDILKDVKQLLLSFMFIVRVSADELSHESY